MAMFSVNGSLPPLMGVGASMGVASLSPPTSATSPAAWLDPDAKVLTKIDIQGYRPKEFYTRKLWAWLQIQAQGLADVQTVDRFVQKQLSKVQATPFKDQTRSTAELFGLRDIDRYGKRTDLERLFTHTGDYRQQVASQGKAMKAAFTLWKQSPQSLASGTKQFLHASFTKPFTNLWAGQEVVSSTLSGLASVLFVVNIGQKTHQAYDSAYNEGQRGGELAQTTALEGLKETAKGGLTWMAGSIGAAVIGHSLGMNLASIKEGSKLFRFKTLPTRVAVILGAVATGATVQSILDWVLPSRPVVEKVSLNDLKRQSEVEKIQPAKQRLP
jgi:hypothetical protein